MERAPWPGHLRPEALDLCFPATELSPGSLSGVPGSRGPAVAAQPGRCSTGALGLLREWGDSSWVCWGRGPGWETASGWFSSGAFQNGEQTFPTPDGDHSGLRFQLPFIHMLTGSSASLPGSVVGAAPSPPSAEKSLVKAKSGLGRLPAPPK